MILTGRIYRVKTFPVGNKQKWVYEVYEVPSDNEVLEFIRKKTAEVPHLILATEVRNLPIWGRNPQLHGLSGVGIYVINVFALLSYASLFALPSFA